MDAVFRLDSQLTQRFFFDADGNAVRYVLTEDLDGD